MESASGMEVGPQSSLKLDPWGLVSRFGESYRQRLIKDPGLATRLEGACRTISYVIAGRFQASNELSELAYSVSNLLVLIHDGILHKPSQYQTAQFLSHRKLRSWLTVIGYLEVVVEMGAGRAGGDHARWLLITAIEITKLVLRSLLLLWYKIGILPSPPIALHKNSKPSGVSRRCSSSHCFLGKRSKRLVRCLDETSLAPHQFCGVSPYEEGEEEELGDHEDNSDDTMPLDRLQTLAESLHIVRPLIHLFIMARLGQRSWTPWVMSAALDISSLCLIRNPGVLGCRQRAELRRRTLVMLLYLLRSPCYDRFSEAKILFVLRILADNIPGLSLIISPLMEYLPAWQKVYFYLWD